jgi:hypothetical protein
MNTKVDLPKRLQGIFFDDFWETSRVWLLDTHSERVAFGELEWHLDLTVWTTVPGVPRWDLSPRMVLDNPDLYPWNLNKISNADLSFPLEMFRHRERWVILDGYHRLARHHLEGSESVLVRRHPKTCWDYVRRTDNV